jgi:hypothetical protein
MGLFAPGHQSLQGPFHLRQRIGLDHEDGHVTVPRLATQKGLTPQPLPDTEHDIRFSDVVNDPDGPSATADGLLNQLR